ITRRRMLESVNGIGRDGGPHAKLQRSLRRLMRWGGRGVLDGAARARSTSLRQSEWRVHHRRRSGLAWLVLRGRFGSALFGAGHRLFLLSLQLPVVSSLLGAVALGALKAIIRFTHQQTPGNMQRVKTRPILATLFGGLALFSTRGSPRLFGDPRSVTLALEPFAHRLTVAADSLGLLSRSALGGLFVRATPFHLAKRALTLHLFLQDADRAVDVVIADIDLHGLQPFL